MIDVIKPLIKQFLPFAQERMGFQDPPKLFMRRDEQNAQNPLGKTAHYDPAARAVTLYISGRHPKDVMRSLSHELVHHAQCCNGEFENVGEMGAGYAQNDTHLREMERQAYEIGNLCFRDWEDSIKQTIYFEHLQKGVEKVMSTKDWKNGEIKSLLSEAWGFKMNLSKLNEESESAAQTKKEEAKAAADAALAGENLDGTLDEQELGEMGCGSPEGAEDEVVVMQGADDEGPADPNAIVDELSDLVARLQSALGGMGGEEAGEAGGEMAIDIQERFKKALKKALVEVHNDGVGDDEDNATNRMMGQGQRERFTGGSVDIDPLSDEEQTAGTEAYYELYEFLTSSNLPGDKPSDKLQYALRWIAKFEQGASSGEPEEKDLEERRARGRKDPRTQRGPPDPRARALEEALRKALRVALIKKAK